MNFFSQFSFIILVIASLDKRNLVSGNSISTCGGIFEGDSGEFEYHRENLNSNVDNSTGSSVCVWMIKLLGKEGAGVSLKLEDLDGNSVVNFYAEGEPTDPVNSPITLNSTQINSSVELSGKIFIITLKSQLDELETSPTKFVVSWNFLGQLSTVDSNSNGSKTLPVGLTSTNYFAAGGEKGRYNFKNLSPLQKSVWILDAGFGGSLDAEVNVQFDSSCLSKFKSKGKSQMSPKSLCECSYFGLFEIVPSSGKLRSVNEICGRSGYFALPKLSTQLVVFIYSMNPNSDSGSDSGESAQINWERNKETTIPTTTTQKTTTTEFPSSTEPPIEVSKCPDNSTISPCTCNIDRYGVDMVCAGPAVNQTSVEKAFREIREVNEIPEGSGISIYRFKLDQTELTQLDLEPFYGSRFDWLEIQDNYNLTKLVTPGSGHPPDKLIGPIHAIFLSIAYSPLKREGLGKTLKYFSNEMIELDLVGLDLNDDKNSNSDESESEFLPGLSTHTNLARIVLIYNDLDEIGENFFNFDSLADYLYIDLHFNNLNETSFHPNSGIARPGRRTGLELMGNQISTLPSDIFEPFLDAHPQNALWLYRNPLICDGRVSWLKSRRDEFEQRVHNSYCTNNPAGAYTIFNSNLVP